MTNIEHTETATFKADLAADHTGRGFFFCPRIYFWRIPTAHFQ
jgi:hypothetical protein